MPAVTINTQKFTVQGNLRANFYNVTGNTGDTLAVGLNTVKQVIADPAITSATVAVGSIPGQSVVTLNGTISAANVSIWGN